MPLLDRLKAFASRRRRWLYAAGTAFVLYSAFGFFIAPGILKSKLETALSEATHQHRAQSGELALNREHLRRAERLAREGEQTAGELGRALRRLTHVAQDLVLRHASAVRHHIDA